MIGAISQNRPNIKARRPLSSRRPGPVDRVCLSGPRGGCPVPTVRAVPLPHATPPAVLDSVPSFTVAQRNGRWILADPQGQPFFSTGIDCIWDRDDEGPPGPKYDGLADNGGDEERWAAQTRARMDAWNVNTVGAWSKLRGKPYVVELSLTRGVMDVFDEGFEDRVRAAAQDSLGRADVGQDYAEMDRDPNLIGYFTDNELYWGWAYSWRDPGMTSLFEDFAALPADHSGKLAWARYMAQAYDNDFDRLSQAWQVEARSVDELAQVSSLAPRNLEEADRVADGFLRLAADRYFSVTNKVGRELLGHHLNLGPRLTDWFPRPVAEAAGKYCDVVSVNVYNRDLTHMADTLTAAHEASQRPVLLTEYAFPARENRSGNKNEGYGQAEVKDDAERGEYFARTADLVAGMPFMVGAHWFQYFDEPTNGRGDGESCNFGWVDLQNRIYDEMAQRATEANARLLASVRIGSIFTKSLS